MARPLMKSQTLRALPYSTAGETARPRTLAPRTSEAMGRSWLRTSRPSASSARAASTAFSGPAWSWTSVRPPSRTAKLTSWRGTASRSTASTHWACSAWARLRNLRREQVAHLDGSSLGGARVLDRARLAAFDFDARAVQRVRLAGEQREAADRSHAGERLAAEAVAAHGEEIVLGAQLAGGVALQAQPGVRPRHAATVVADADQLAAALEQVDLHAGGAGVERVLDQLFDGGGGAFDHLAGGDLVGERIGEDMDARHGCAQ